MLRVTRELVEELVLWVCQVYEAHRVLQVLALVALEILAYQVELVLLVRQVTQVRLEVEGRLETLDQPVRLDELVVRVTMVSVVW